ncbi:MAG TPA: ATP-binding protein [Candidatus Kapabacteria bacterium]|nr:ATP-binding protein [Candidatus Kapabacteria bacterium]
MTDRLQGRSIKPALHLHLGCSFAEVRRGAIQIRQFLQKAGLSEKDTWACELAFTEGCNNAVQHTPAAETGKKIVINLSLDGGQVELRINDHSPGCTYPEAASLPPAEHERGRGIFLIQSLMDDVTYTRRDSSNCLILKKALTGI